LAASRRTRDVFAARAHTKPLGQNENWCRVTQTIGEAVASAARALAGSGIEGGRREARILVALALGIDQAVVLGFPERPVPAAALPRLTELIERRCAREPISRILGHREFWSLDFELSPDTLDPRGDSETVVEAVLAHIPGREAALKILDLGTGTGCLLLAVLSEYPAATGIGIDLAPGAAATARRNAARLGFAERASFAVADWDAALGGCFDLVLSNPPYIEAAAIDDLEPEVARHDPRRALDGGADGLDFYRRLAASAPRLLRPGGIGIFEVGAGQAEAVAALMEACGLETIETRPDLAGIARCVVVRLQPS